MNQSKYIYLLAGPSGSGKSSVARKITEWYGFKEVWSYTERPPRYAGEPGHIFVTPEEFDAAGPMCAFTLYNGYRYGVPQSEIDSSLLYVIDPAGIEYMKNHYAGSKGITVIGIWAPEEVRRERMISRGDAPAMVDERLRIDAEEFKTLHLMSDVWLRIDRWEKSNDTEEKRDLLAAIGEIGVDVHNRNRQLGIL